MSQKHVWTKMSGAGNRFWIGYFPFFARIPKQNRPGKARALCRNNTADGMVILLPSADFDFEWLFYNADGSTAEMCGNAACCVTNYIFTKKLIAPDKTAFTLKTESGPVKGEWIEGRARIILKQSLNIKGPFSACFKAGRDGIWQTVKIKGLKEETPKAGIFKSKQYSRESLTYMFINSAVPHAVIRLPKWPAGKKAWEVKTQMARLLRKSVVHHKKGMNVSFYCEKKQVVSAKPGNGALIARTFERGVENFTPACGTGALATAQVYRALFPNLNSVLVQMPGGKLKVTFHPGKKISLAVPVKKLSERWV